MKNFIQTGDTLTVVAPRVLVSGEGCLVGSLFGVASDDAASGASAEIVMEGVFDLAKDASVFAQGDKVYWDNTAFKITSTTTANKLCGVAAAAALTGDTTGRVKLNQTNLP